MKHWLLLVALVACGRRDFDPILDGSGSAGTRLHDVDEVFETGPRITIEQYDSLLDTRCFIYPTTSGLRCLPANAAVPHYLDAACTQPALPVPDPGAPPAYLYKGNDNPIDRIYAVGAEIGTPAMSYMLQYDGTCAADATPNGVWRSATAVPFEMFAGLAPVLGAGMRVRAQQLVADDGYSTPGPLHDTEVGADCLAWTFTDGTQCTPYPADFAYFYTDAACSHVVIHAIVPVSYGLVMVNTPACTQADLQVRPVIADIDPMPLYVEIPGDTSCVQSQRAPGYRVLDLGAPLSLATLVRQRTTTGKRLEEYEVIAGAATAIDANTVYDTQLMTDCRPGAAADGMTRCLPTSTIPLQTGYFSDAACSAPLQLAIDNIAACAGQPPVRFAAGFPTATIHTLGAQYTGPLYSGTPASCTSATSNLPLYTVGAELPPATFALVTEETAPP